MVAVYESTDVRSLRGMCLKGMATIDSLTLPFTIKFMFLQGPPLM